MYSPPVTTIRLDFGRRGLRTVKGGIGTRVWRISCYGRNEDCSSKKVGGIRIESWKFNTFDEIWPAEALPAVIIVIDSENHWVD